ncbi:uncharacterized protein A4U43_C07F22690 [Asparagus officinalis]|uniref:Uncharacterized protein n=1 Tax=Asparagus officinalis TaxID=4686 RepID=A0A5P1EG20_ASPOF|nr:uncharacterized protein A4U43_C07F22690 [Asparagus officinalis]
MLGGIVKSRALKILDTINEEEIDDIEAFSLSFGNFLSLKFAWRVKVGILGFKATRSSTEPLITASTTSISHDHTNLHPPSTSAPAPPYLVGIVVWIILMNTSFIV